MCPMKIMASDVSRAYFYAPSVRPVYVQVVDEDRQPGDENMCGRLSVSMYGTRDAALNWHEHYRDHLISLGSDQGRASPCLFYHKDRGIRVFEHGDDYVSSGHGRRIKKSI